MVAAINPDGGPLVLCRGRLDDAVSAIADPQPVTIAGAYRFADPVYTAVRGMLSGADWHRTGVWRATAPCRVDVLAWLVEVDAAVFSWHPDGDAARQPRALPTGVTDGLAGQRGLQPLLRFPPKLRKGRNWLRRVAAALPQTSALVARVSRSVASRSARRRCSTIHISMRFCASLSAYRNAAVYGAERDGGTAIEWCAHCLASR